MICSICQSSDVEIIFGDTIESSEWNLYGTHYDYVRCNDCSFLQSYPIPSEDVLLQFYQEQYGYDWFQRNIYFKKIQARHRLWKIRRHVKGSKRILDFGCGHGFFVQELAKKGFDSYGFDIGSDKIMHHNNAHITNKNSLQEYSETGFDVITAWHVLEHMRDQKAILEELKQRLNPGGTLIIAVPNTNSMAFKSVGQKWSWLQQPYVHINQYNGDNLSLLLTEHGLSICSVTTTDTWDQNLYDLLISRLVYKNKSRNPARRFNETVSGNAFFRINQAARLAFTPISYIVSSLRASRNEGNELLVVAQKPN